MDPEPNDLPEQAIVVDPATGSASGRLTSSADIDTYVVDIDEALATGLVDIVMSWADGQARTLCLQTEERVQVGCEDAYEEVALRGVLVPQGRYLLIVRGAGGPRRPVSPRGHALGDPAASP